MGGKMSPLPLWGVCLVMRYTIEYLAWEVVGQCAGRDSLETAIYSNLFSVQVFIWPVETAVTANLAFQTLQDHMLIYMFMLNFLSVRY
jgi:hypothetical protein